MQFVAEMLDEKRRGGEDLRRGGGGGGEDGRPLTFSWPWVDPRLWDVGQPNLYTLRLKVKGAGLDDEYNQQFGFREFWIEGRILLNGTEIRLRQGCFYWGSARRSGRTSGRSELDRGCPRRCRRREQGLDDADRKGYLAAVYVLNIDKYMMNPGNRLIWEQNRQRALERAAVWIRHYRNHPSAVMWIAGLNFFNSAVDADPRHVGRRGWDETDARWQRLMAAGKEMFDGLKKLDPTRVYYSHAGAYTGDVYTMNCYLDLIPLQEREDWLSQWAETARCPFPWSSSARPWTAPSGAGATALTAISPASPC